MAYDRYDNRSEGNWRSRDSDRAYGRGPGNRDDDRGFFERAGDEIASWFGDDEAEQRRRRDEQRERMQGGQNRDYDRGYGRDYDRDRQSFRSHQRDQDDDRSSARPMNWTSSDSDYRSSSPRSSRGYDRMGYGGQDRDFTSRGGLGGSMSSDYMSPTGPSFGYGGSYGAGSSGGYGSGGYGSSYGGSSERSRDYRPMAGDYGRSDTQWGRDDYRNTSYAGSTRDNDRHYHAWRQRQLDDLDRDYDNYCRERQDRFENDFGSWRSDRMNKRQKLGQVREHMDVVGSDGESIGKVDCVKGDHIVLTKSDSDDNRHHSIDCSMVETIEGDQIRLNMPAEEAKSRMQEGDKRGLFGRDDNDRDQHTNLDRAFSGTYES